MKKQNQTEWQLQLERLGRQFEHAADEHAARNNGQSLKCFLVHAGPGETVSVDDLAADVTRLLGLGVAPDEAESGLRGSSFTASRPDRRRSPGTRRA